MDKNTNENLILKTLAKLKNGAGAAWEFTKNKVVPYIVAGGMVLTMAACTPKNTDTNTNQTDSSWSDTTDSNISSDNTTDSSTDSSTDTSTDTTKPEEDKLSKYSPLVREMLTNEEYVSLLSLAENGRLSYSSAHFDPHPYAFLEDQGHDVENIKAGKIECNTQAFTKVEDPNALYIATYVENAGGYYTEYMLKFNLTEKEMQDYKNFHNEKFIQSVFLNDWISSNKSAVIVSKMNVDIETHNGLAETLSLDKNVMGSLGLNKKDLFLIFSSAEKDSRLFNVYAMEHIFEYNNMSTSRKVADIPMRAWSNYSFDNNMIYFSSYWYSNFEIFDITDIADTRVYYNQTTTLNSSANDSIKDALN